jgi:hypothetical protein
MPTRERIRELLPVLKAYSDGKTIERRDAFYKNQKWIREDVSVHPSLGFMEDPRYEYRIAGDSCASSGNTSVEWTREGVAEVDFARLARAWWDDSGVWKPVRVRHWDPGVLVKEPIRAGDPVLFNAKNLLIKPDRSVLVVGICGKARAGKDTAAKILEAHAGFTRVAFADAIRESFFGVDGNTWELTKDLESAGKSRRWAAQIMGSEAREDLPSPTSETLWCDMLMLKLRYLSHYHPAPRRRFVVPDFRFPHEPDRVREVLAGWGGRLVLLKVVRPGSGLSGEEAAHKSEQHELDADHVVGNDGTIEEFAHRLDAMMRNVL